MSIKNLLVNKLDIPRELIFNEPRIISYGKSQIIIERHERVINYTNDTLIVKTSMGTVKVLGKNFVLRNYGKDDVIVEGEIHGFLYEEE